MAFLASQFHQLFIHHVHERGDAARGVLSQGIGSLVAGDQKQRVETILYGKFISGHDTDFISAVGLNLVDSRRRKCYSILQIAIFQDDECCEDLGDAGRIVRQVNVLAMQNGAGIHIHDNARFSHDAGVRGPVGFCPGRQNEQLAC